MPIYDPDHIEYRIDTGYVQIVLDSGHALPAYWAHPAIGRKFPGVAVIHDWWGMTDMMRRLANLFAQMGHYVIVPDLFDGVLPKNPTEAIKVVQHLKDNGYPRVDDALKVLESHHQVNKNVAAVGIGLGGSMAFEAAIVRDDLEAAVAFGGFPHRYFGQFHKANTPIYAFYGADEPFIQASVIQRLHKELSSTPQDVTHQVEVVPGITHDFFSHTFTPQQREVSRGVLKKVFDFLDKHLEQAPRPQRPVY